MNRLVSLRVALALGTTASLLAACGGGGSAAPAVSAVQKVQISGTITGLSPGTSVVLQDNGADNLTVTANGTFTFSQDVAAGSAYRVTVPTNPLHETCAVSNGGGTAATNVTGVAVACAQVWTGTVRSVPASGCERRRIISAGGLPAAASARASDVPQLPSPTIATGCGRAVRRLDVRAGMRLSSHGLLALRSVGRIGWCRSTL